MINTVSTSTKPPQAPNPPVLAQQALEELIQYYQELGDYHRSSVEYHQKLVAVAENQLASLKSILNPKTDEETVSQGGSKDSNGRVETEEKLEQATTIETEPEVVKEETGTTEEKESESGTRETVIQELPSKKVQAKAQSNKSKGNKGTKAKPAKKKEKTNQKNQKAAPASKSKMPPSEKLEVYLTLNNAVGEYLRERSPEVVSAGELVKHYYPEGLDSETKKRVRVSFSKCLSNGAGKQGWVRTSIGKYRWQDRT